MCSEAVRSERKGAEWNGTKLKGIERDQLSQLELISAQLNSPRARIKLYQWDNPILDAGIHVACSLLYQQGSTRLFSVLSHSTLLRLVLCRNMQINSFHIDHVLVEEMNRSNVKSSYFHAIILLYPPIIISSYFVPSYLIICNQLICSTSSVAH